MAHSTQHDAEHGIGTLDHNASSNGPDAAAPKYARGLLLNQSFVSLIANVGSNPTLNPRLHSLDDTSPLTASVRHDPPPRRSPPPPSMARTQILEPPTRSSFRKHRNLPSQDDIMTTSQILQPPGRTTQPSLTATSSTSEAVDREPQGQSHKIYDQSEDVEAIEPNPDEESSDLSRRLATIFGFNTVENVTADFNCCLVQDALIRGTMYITKQHVCFFAHIPVKSPSSGKTGFLFKRGRQNPKYNKYWFVLKGTSLLYYSNPENLYFPRNTIDLRKAHTIITTTSLSSESETTFIIKMSDGDVYLRAETEAYAKDWVKHLQNVIFRHRNGADSVKIILPVDNILDVERDSCMGFADTFRFVVIDNDQTYTIDEYFFAFFGFTTADMFKITAALRPKPSTTDVRALSPTKEVEDVQFAFAEPLPNNDQDPQKTQGNGPHLASRDREPQPVDSNDDQASDLSRSRFGGSQILSGSEVFHKPTIRQNRRPGSTAHQARFSAPIQGTISNATQLEPAHDSDLTRDSNAANVSRSKPSQSPESSDINANTVQRLMRAGSYSYQRATQIANVVQSHSERVGKLLTGGSLGYYEKVSSMWAGKHAHYHDSEGPVQQDLIQHVEDVQVSKDAGDRFRSYFALPSGEKLQAAYFAWLDRGIPIYGKLYVGERKLCFRSLVPGTTAKMILPMRDIESLDKKRGFRLGFAGMIISIKGHEELFMEFQSIEARDDCAVTVLGRLQNQKALQETLVLTTDERLAVEKAEQEFAELEQARALTSGPNAAFDVESDSDSDDIFDETQVPASALKPVKSQTIVCLTIGSRGDVQPYIALCKRLKDEGHHPIIATHAEFGDWIRRHGIEFRPVAGDPAEIMQLCVEHDMFTVSFLREALWRFRGWLDDLLLTSWQACQGADILIESPSAMAGLHIAEALQIPYFRAFTMPWTRTRAYPHAFAIPENKKGGAYNSLTYVIFENVFWGASSGQINAWRTNTLKLPATTLARMRTQKVPFLYNFSINVVPRPLDLPPWVRFTGYWFLDEGEDYVPPNALVAFIEAARREGKKLVYVGFGSVIVEDPAALTRTVVESVQKADVRCILSKGWSDRLDTVGKEETEMKLPEYIHQIKSAPHDWLFSQVDAAAHHGGAGTTGASLRAGIPTIVKPFFGDQFFFGSRIQDLGVGLCLRSINVKNFARALWEATNNQRLILKAKAVGAEIRKEDGTGTAVQAIYRDLEYARSLIRRSATKEDVEDVDEWQFVDDEARGSAIEEWQTSKLQGSSRSGSNMNK